MSTSSTNRNTKTQPTREKNHNQILDMSNQRWSLPINPNASLLSRLYCLLESLHDASDVLKAWPAESGNQEGQESSEKSSSHYIQTTKLMNELSSVITNLKSVETRVEEIQQVETKAAQAVAEKGGSVQQQKAAKILDGPVPLDLLDLLDFGATKSEPGIGVHPECFARCLLAETSRQLIGLRRRKNALEKLGHAIDEGVKKQREPLFNVKSLDSSTANVVCNLKRKMEEVEEESDQPQKAKQKLENST